ncbi:hypothetical protein B9Z65_4591 [Elsinoe australis]|uniref:Uncharacterized protein n=1 Tax=Elsinoe australis TaxID=40998 RepID=A0A2P8A5G5_9PEZI|nr:hypothetical protein B9Z65_4591 [Elsinoe australis]
MRVFEGFDEEDIVGGLAVDFDLDFDLDHNPDFDLDHDPYLKLDYNLDFTFNLDATYNLDFTSNIDSTSDLDTGAETKTVPTTWAIIKLSVVMESYLHLAASKNASIDSIRRIDFQDAYSTQLQRLLRLPTGACFKNAKDPVNIDEDAEFAAKVCKPLAMDLLLAPSPPTVEELLKIRWVDTENPFVYSCLARVWNENNKLIVAANLMSQMPTPKKHSASHGSRFHQVRQFAAARPEYTVEYSWGTLAEGSWFGRSSDADEKLAAIWYEIEGIFSSAFGAIADDSRDLAYLALKGAHWQTADDDDDDDDDNYVEFEWEGLDGHNALETPGLAVKRHLSKSRRLNVESTSRPRRTVRTSAPSKVAT